ncbi:MAG: DUF3592 domain-containing protein [Eubacteriales bacterium]|nr:DUF3592 domain-containing protein [Eubacteriales bacterium]
MIIAGFMVFVIGVIFIISYPINKRKNARCTGQTQGMLVEIRRRYGSKGRRKSMHVYSYSVNGIEYMLKTLDYSPQADRVGDVCPIWYNPAKPEDAQAFHGTDKYLRTLLIIGIVMVLLGMFLTCLGFVQQFIL